MKNQLMLATLILAGTSLKSYELTEETKRVILNEIQEEVHTKKDTYFILTMSRLELSLNVELFQYQSNCSEHLTEVNRKAFLYRIANLPDFSSNKIKKLKAEVLALGEKIITQEQCEEQPMQKMKKMQEDIAFLKNTLESKNKN